MEAISYMSLDASKFETSDINYEQEFINLMQNIYKCYKLIVHDSIRIPKNDENAIRDILLLNYINDTNTRHNKCAISGYRFHKEVDVNDGRVDIKIDAAYDFEEFDSYFIIECKRLDGKNALNRAYVNHGIKRFTTSYRSSSLKYYYPSSYGVNGMIGFVINNIDVDANINGLAAEFNTLKKDILYESNHTNVKLFHLMMDFSR